MTKSIRKLFINSLDTTTKTLRPLDQSIKKYKNISFPEPTFNNFKKTRYDEMVLRGGDIPAHIHNSYESQKLERLNKLVDRRIIRSWQTDALFGKKVFFIKYPHEESSVSNKTKQKSEVRELVEELNPKVVVEEKDSYNEKFEEYIHGKNGSGGVHTIGLISSNDSQNYNFKNKYGVSVPHEIMALKERYPSLGIGSVSISNMGYDEDWRVFSKAILSDVKLKHDILAKLDDIRYKI